jgi:iron only hydrogenase large subunit-like protein
MALKLLLKLIFDRRGRGLVSYENLIYTNKDKCIGCTNCIKRCPTEAIRVKNGKAITDLARCIYCGECLRACPYHANQPNLDKMDVIFKFEKRIAILDPSIFSQFKNLKSMERLFQGVKNIGFTDVYDVSRALRIITTEEKRLIAEQNNKPLISSSCPTISKMIQTGFPGLINNLIKIESFFELTAKLVLDDMKYEDRAKTGIFFITPCVAKASIIKKPFYKNESIIDGVIAISDIYPILLTAISEINSIKTSKEVDTESVKWAVSGGETHSVGCENSLWVDGVANVVNIFEQIEMENLKDIDFIEACACSEGCVGGPLTVENKYVAKSRIDKFSSNYSKLSNCVQCEDYTRRISWDLAFEYKPVLKLDKDLKLAIKKLEDLELINERLPGLDCGACGAPTCRAFAEDVVRGLIKIEDCIISQNLKSGE